MAKKEAHKHDKPIFVYVKTRTGLVFPQKWLEYNPYRTEQPIAKWELDEETSHLSLLKLSEMFPYQPPPQEPKVALDYSF